MTKVEEGLVRVLLTHDVDYPSQGPGREHILARRDRFSEEVIERVLREDYNPYFGIPEIMEMEKEYGFRSTFFFRPRYDDGTHVKAYESVLKELMRGGWEVSLHINNAESVESIVSEKRELEEVLGARVYGSRVHYLRIDVEHLPLLGEAGFKYDSSICFNKNEVDARNAGFFYAGGVLEFPVTVMDAYLFTYMKVPENKVLSYIEKAINLGFSSGFITILWHDSSIHMKGGRIYPKILELLHSRDDVEVMRMIDAYKLISGDHA
jgi:peptidoglycan/xylan/chitin deacetylase (PgdA/CDA1 family)